MKKRIFLKYGIWLGFMVFLIAVSYIPDCLIYKTGKKTVEQKEELTLFFKIYGLSVVCILYYCTSVTIGNFSEWLTNFKENE